MGKNVLVTEDLTKSFKNFPALDRLNLKITENSCVGFLGPNGAGKTTTIKILSGLIRPTSGSAFIDGVDVTQDITKALTNVGIIVETPVFYPYLTPNEILSYFGKIRGLSKNILREKIERTLKIVRLEKWHDKKIGKFSKGMKQRLALASAILHDPDLLILDEPTSGLDPRGASEVRDIIRTLKSSGKTIFMSSHILSEVQAVCDEIVLIDKGKLIRHEKIENLNSKFTLMEIKCLDPITDNHLSLISKIDGIHSLKIKDSSTLIVQFEGSLDQRANLLKKLQEIGLQIISFTNVTTDLESLYMNQISESVR